MRNAPPPEAPAPSPAELARCDREPIHIPGLIQPFGILLAVEDGSGVVGFASRNVSEVVGLDWEDVLGRSIVGLFDRDRGGQLFEALGDPALDANPTALGTIRGGDGRAYLAIAHRHDGRAVLELDASTPEGLPPFHGLYPEVRTFLGRLGRVRTIEDLTRLAAQEVRRITGFDRVLVYRFDRDQHGTVVAEDRNDELPPYLGLRFPASDIPAQARELYLRNRLRIIADVGYEPVPIEPAEPGGRPLDLTYSTLRSVSPVHIEYMRNMGTAASMSISIVVDDRLWGLISCHNRGPKLIPFELRTACDFLGQVLSLQLAAQEHRDDFERKMSLKSIQARLLAHMACEENFIDGLVNQPDDLLAFAGADGAAIVFEGHCSLIGTGPSEADVRRIVAWLAENGRDDVYAIDSLPDAIPWAESIRERASGLLAIPISKLHNSYVLWFRPEIVRTVNWAGDPGKPFEETPGGPRLHPRRSFQIWKQTVGGSSLTWQAAEIEAAGELRTAIVGIVLLKAEELAQIAGELRRSNRELEAFSYSVSHDLRAPFRHIVGYSELLLDEPELGERSRRFVHTIIDSARYAGTLVDNLLSLAQMGRTALHPIRVDMNRLVDEVRRDVASEEAGRRIEWAVSRLPECVCDPLMMKLAVRNLLSNAIKYTRRREEARVEIGVEGRAGEWAFFVRDNGIGFDMQYVDKLFGVFQRLHRMEEYEGTGIGLANVQRIVERHGGRVWAEGRPGEGATFWFTLPRAAEPGGKG